MADVLEMAKGRKVDDYTGNRLVGDLHSFPDALRRLVDQDVYALEWARQYAAPSEVSWIDTLIRQRQDILRSELEKADPILDALIRTQVNHQMRSRIDLETGKTVVEQWIPALRCWLVNGVWDPTVPTWEIVKALKAGDPRNKTPEEALQESREQAQAQRAKNEAAGDQRVKDVVAGLGERRIEQFLDVERALQTGEQINVRGDDRRQIEKLTDQTREAANKGDIQAQNVILQGGVRDDRTCILPTTNPFRHRHRKELENTKDQRRK